MTCETQIIKNQMIEWKNNEESLKKWIITANTDSLFSFFD